jgi:putative DNA primase/helicase
MAAKREKRAGPGVGAVLAAGAKVRDEIAADLGPAFLQPGVGASLVRMSEVASEEIDWLWERWIPSRMLTILGGYGGDGKSTVMASLISAWTTAGALPDGSVARQTNVLMLSAEDDVSYAIRPRLDLHGTDSSRVFVLKGTIRGDGQTRWFDLRRDVEIMRGVIRKHRIGLVVIDPLGSYLPKSDRNNEGDIRDALQPLIGLMETTGVGVVGIMHVGKAGDGRRASQRLLGSTAFTALARSVLMIADQPEERQPDDVASMGKLKVLQVVKSNYSIPPAPQVFRRPLDAPIAWLGASEIGIEECFAVYPRMRGPEAKELADAMEFLRELLAAGPVRTAEVMSQARGQGFSERTLRRAKKKLGVVANRQGDSGAWQWSLGEPEDEEKAAK